MAEPRAIDQVPWIRELSAKLKAKRSVLGQAPTGFGKTFIASYLIRKISESGESVFFCVHRHQLLSQTSRELFSHGIGHRYIAPTHKYDESVNVHVAMLQTLMRRMNKVKPPKFLILDEAHIAASKGADSVIKWVLDNGGYVIGLSATPERTNGQGLDKQFNDIVIGPEVRWLIDNNLLAEYDFYGPDVFPDMSKAGSRGGDFKDEDVERIMNTSSITGSAIEMYGTYADKQPAIVFCQTKKHAHDVAQMFCEAGYKFVAVDDSTPNKVRENYIKDLENGIIHGICNVALFVEGLDVKVATCCILLNPTKSIIRYRQAIGRVMRYLPGKRAIIIDHAGNVFRHLLPCFPRVWSLQGTKSESRRTEAQNAMSLRHCGDCRAIYDAKLSVCPRCNSPHIIEPRHIKIRKGGMRKITPEEIEAMKRQKLLEKLEVWNAKTLEELIAIGKKRNYDNPRGWAIIKWKLKKKKQGRAYG